LCFLKSGTGGQFRFHEVYFKVFLFLFFDFCFDFLLPEGHHVSIWGVVCQRSDNLYHGS